MPSRASVGVVDKCGNLCTSAMDQGQRWCLHFDKVLNIQSMFNADVLDGVSQQPVLEELADIPTCAEIENAIRELANGKDAGESGILHGMVKAGGPLLINALVSFLQTVWKDECVRRDWLICNLVPIPKKDDFRLCDNWRGIALLDVVGKTVARIVQSRLQVVSEEILPETQCGFRKGRFRIDMVFTVRQVVKELYEHQQKAFLVFNDLKKAYYYVNRDCMWAIL